MSTVVMRVDLECEKCYKKIRKVLCKVQDKVSIRTISYDEKNSTVTVSGPFDGEEVVDRLTSDAGKVITDIHVVGGAGGGFGFALGGGGGKQKHGAAANPGKAPKPGKEKGHGHGQGQGHGHGGHGGGGGHGVHGGGGHDKHGGKPEKKQVKFDDLDMDMDDDDFDLDDMDEPVGRHAHGGHGHNGHGNGGGKPKIIRTTNTPIAARLEAPRTGPAMSMAAQAPVRMPMPGMGPMPQHQPQHHQAQGMGVPSIWPAAPEWHYSTQPYSSYSTPPAGGYYGGGVPANAYGPAGHWPYGGGYGRNPYAQQQYYEEEPSACSVM